MWGNKCTHVDSDTQYDALEKRLLEQMMEHLKVNEKQFGDLMEEKVWTVHVHICTAVLEIIGV